MSTLDSLFNAPQHTGAENPMVKFDYKTQSLRFRFLAEFNELKGPVIRHWIENVGYVECNQKPYRRKDGTFGLWGDCKFCNERKAFRDQLKASAIADGRTDLTKEEAGRVSKLHKRNIELFAPVQVEIREKKKVVKELEVKGLGFRISDLFFTQVTQQYKTLSQIYESKGTLLDHWFAMSGNGAILLDDKLDKEEKAQEFELPDLSYVDQKTKAYEDGVKAYEAKATATAKAEPLPDEDDEEPVF
jgi:hypothetical protein